MAFEDHAGLLEQAIPHYGRHSFVNISNTKTEYTFFPQIMRRARSSMDAGLYWGLPQMVQSVGGYEFTFQVQVSKGSTFQWVRETTPINVTRRDYQKRVTLPWRMCRTDWSINKRELRACRNEEEITNLVTSRRLGDDQDWVDGFEDWGWGDVPASTDEETAFPMRYWTFTPYETNLSTNTPAGADTAKGNGSSGDNSFQGNGDFLGGAANLDHANFTSGRAGLSAATYEQWSNYYVQYTSFNDALIDKLGHCIMRTRFYAPVEFPDKAGGAPDRAIYTGLGNYLAHGKLARQQNDQNTSDTLARTTDAMTLRIPWYYVPKIDDLIIDADNSANKSPLFGLDWNSWYLATTDEYNLQDEIFEPDRAAPQDLTHARYLEGQLVCCYPRNQWIATT